MIASDERLGAALDRVAAGLALPLAAGEIALELLGAPRRLKRTMVMTRRAAWRPSGAAHGDAGVDPVAAAREQPQARARAVATSAALGSIRRPQATTVSAARTKQRPSGRRAAIALVLAAARRLAWARGSSRGDGVSSTSGASIALGSTPIWRSSASRRGEDEARISGGLPGTRYLKR